MKLLILLPVIMLLSQLGFTLWYRLRARRETDRRLSVWHILGGYSAVLACPLGVVALRWHGKLAMEMTIILCFAVIIIFLAVAARSIASPESKADNAAAELGR
jgi:hypothetical protein